MSDRIYIAERSDGLFACGSIWKETNGGPEGVGTIIEVHDDHIIGRLHDGDPVRFDFVGKRFDDTDGDKSQAIRQPFEPITNETMFITLRADETINDNFHSVWVHDKRLPNDELECNNIAKIKTVHDDHIIVNFFKDRRFGSNAVNNVCEEKVRLNITDNKFKDCGGDNAVEVVRVEKAAQAEEPTAQTEKPAQQPTVVVGSKFYKHGNFWCEVTSLKYVKGELMGDVKYSDGSPHIKGIMKMSLYTNDPNMECRAPTQQAPAVGQYVFEDGKFFGKVTKGDGRHIRIDSPNNKRVWFPVCDAKEKFEFHTIEPGMWLVPKTSEVHSESCVHRLIERLVPDPWLNGEIHPMVVTDTGESFFFDAIIKEYDIVRREGVTLPIAKLDSNDAVKYDIGVDFTQQPAQQPQDEVFDEYGKTLDVGYEVFYKVSGEVCGTVIELHPDNQITMEFTPGVTDDTVVAKPNIIPCYNPRVDAGDGQVWGFCPHNWGYTDDQRIVRINRLETAEKAEPAPNGRTAAQARIREHFHLALDEAAKTVLPKYLPVESKYEALKHPKIGEYILIDGLLSAAHITNINGDRITVTHDGDGAELYFVLGKVKGNFVKLLPLEDDKKVCPRCDSFKKWQSSIRPEYGTDFCVACNIWWTSGDCSKPIINTKNVDWSSVKRVRDAQKPAQPFKPVDGTIFVNIENDKPHPLWKEHLWRVKEGYTKIAGKIKSWHDDHVVVTLKDEKEHRMFYFTKNTFKDFNGDPAIEVVESPADSITQQAAQADKDWVVDDEFEIQIFVGDIVFSKASGEVCGAVIYLRDDNELDIQFGKAGSKHNLGKLCYHNPRSECNAYGFHRSGQFNTIRMDYIHGLEHQRANAQTAAQRELGEEQAKVAEVQPDATIVSPIAMQAKACKDGGQSIAKAFENVGTAAQQKLAECGLDTVEAEAWINRNRPPVELQNGDTICTTKGIYRCFANKWVKVAGQLRMRSHESVANMGCTKTSVEYKFLSDELTQVEDRGKDFEYATYEKITIPVWGDHIHLNSQRSEDS